jgi:putative membrane protein
VKAQWRCLAVLAIVSISGCGLLKKDIVGPSDSLGSSDSTVSPNTIPSPLSRQDKDWLLAVIQGSIHEVALGEMARSHAGSSDVRDFAQRMIDDYTALIDAGSQLARGKGLQPPDGPSEEQQQMISRLSELDGSSFDREYMSWMVEDHTMVVADAKQEIRDGLDQDVVDFARNAVLPIVRADLSDATDVAASINGSGGDGSGGSGGGGGGGGSGGGGSGGNGHGWGRGHGNGRGKGHWLVPSP